MSKKGREAKSTASKILAQRRHEAQTSHSVAASKRARSNGASDLSSKKAASSQDAIGRALRSAIESGGVHASWTDIFEEQLQRHVRAGLSHEVVRCCLRYLRRLQSDGTDERHLSLCQTAPEKAAAGDMAAGLIKWLTEDTAKSLSASTTSVARFETDRFQFESEELSCPSGCSGPVRYGYRVGDLSKYAVMERSEVVGSVRCYCTKCYHEFDSNL